VADTPAPAGAPPAHAADSPAPAADSPAPAPAAPATRTVHADGVEWTVAVVGEAKYGSSRRGIARLELLRFTPVNAPHQRARETYVLRRRFELLYDEELVELLRAARPVPAEPAP